MGRCVDGAGVKAGGCYADSDCKSGFTCEDAGCTGSPSCGQFESYTYCEGWYGRPGCSWDSFVAGHDSLETCEGAGGVWACGDPEICSNGVDDDGDGLVDCMDPACQVAPCDDFSCASVTPRGVSMAEVSRFNCLGTDVFLPSDDLGGFSFDYDGDGVGVEYYCGSPESHEDVGVCCPETYKPVYRAMDDEWSCQDTAVCLVPYGSCDYSYSAGNFTDWMNDPYCLDSSAPSACCSVVQFGDEDYYSDSDNVKVY